MVSPYSATTPIKPTGFAPHPSYLCPLRPGSLYGPQPAYVPGVVNNRAPASDIYCPTHHPKAGYYCGQTVERIITDGYLTIPPVDAVEGLLTDRKQTAKLTMDDVIRQIRLRYHIYEHNVSELEAAKCEAFNVTHNWFAPRSFTELKADPDLQQRLRELYRQRQEERAGLWQDVLRLRLLLPEAAQQYLAAYRKQSLLQDLQGDAE